ncbi:MAG: DUF2017 family protein [Ilumatobacteraceae bacterium]|jgi:hypothetical protein
MGWRKPKGPLQQTSKGVRVTMSAPERELIVRLLDDLRTLILAGGDQAILRRLFPPAYHQAVDTDAEAEYQRLMHDELVAARLAGIETIRAAIADDTLLDDEGTMAFVRSLNQIRLVLGTALDVSEDESIDVDDDHPLVAEYHLYHYLSWLLENALECIT